MCASQKVRTLIKSENNRASIYRRHCYLTPKNQSINHNEILTESFHALTKYRIVASTNTCYYSENQVFGGVTI